MNEKPRESWKSRVGFMFAAVGSAVGLINIWRFPYVVAENGGAAFIAIYVLFLILIGYPVLISEVVLGRTAQRGPAGALETVSGKAPRFWRGSGIGIITTGFIVSSFYSVVAGWILGYFIQSLTGVFGELGSVEAAQKLYQLNVGSPTWCVGYHLIFMVLAVLLLNRGIRKGIELGNRVMMPLLVLLLFVVMVRGLTLPGSDRALRFLFSPDWSLITPMALLTALGHAFFTLSLGQGTMITYGSYLSDHANIPRSCTPIVAFDTGISLLAGIAVLSVVFAGGGELSGGPGLLFYTMPTAFAQIPGGVVMAPLFFFLVLLAALTSQTSALEPMISYLIDDKRWKRRWAVLAVCGGAFLLGVPSALSTNLLAHWTVGGKTFFDWISFIAMDLLIPIGGLVAVLYVGWVWGFRKAFQYMRGDEEFSGLRHRTFKIYFDVTVGVLAPAFILLVFLANLGLF